MQHELAADEALEARATEQREHLLIERPVQGGHRHNRSPASQIVFAGREKQAMQGRRERAYVERTSATEDAAARSFAASQRVRAVRLMAVTACGTPPRPC